MAVTGPRVKEGFHHVQQSSKPMARPYKDILEQPDEDDHRGRSGSLGQALVNEFQSCQARVYVRIIPFICYGNYSPTLV